MLAEVSGAGRYTLGTALEVVCAAADPASGQIDFTLPGGLPAPRPPAGAQGGGAQTAPAGEDRGNRRAMHVPRGRKGRKKR